MNYRKIHDSIISNAKNRLRLNIYTEKHHIIPRCIGGSDLKENLVALTAKEHFLIHWLLVKLHPCNPKLIFAWNMMSSVKVGKRRDKRASRSYRIAKEIFGEIQSKKMLGNKHGKELSGRPKSLETRKKMSEAQKGNKKGLGKHKSEEFKIKARQKALGNKYGVGNAGKPKSAEQIEKMRRPKSSEHKEKIRLGLLGKRHSDETRRKMRLASLRNWKSRKEKELSPSG